jgi:thioredoxin reductase (NADPH)
MTKSSPAPDQQGVNNENEPADSQATNPSLHSAAQTPELEAHAVKSAEEAFLLDCIIIGAGPAGLTSLEYLARFHRTAVALGGSGPRPRLLSIDRTYNLPGYPEGVRGSALLARLREQAESMGGVIRAETAERIEGKNGNFTVHLSDNSTLKARKIIIATGVRDRNPDIPGIEPHIGHFLRYCPVCDGFEHTNKELGILGSGGTVARHALFLKTFSNDITVFLHGEPANTLGRYQEILEEKGIRVQEPRVAGIIDKCAVLDSPVQDSANTDDLVASGTAMPREPDYRGCGVCLEDGSEHSLTVLYIALGCELNVSAFKELDLDLDEDGYIVVDINQNTSIPGIYAAGDVVSQINQISVAFGQATIAAVRIHNALDDEES